MSQVEGWRRSSKCATSTCVEVASIDESILIRDSDYGAFAYAFLAFTREEFKAFVDGVKDGEFDDFC